MTRRQRRGTLRNEGQPTGGSALDAAVAAHRAGRLEEAEAEYRRILAEHPRNADALHLLGLVRHQRGQSAEATKLITRAIRLNPGAARYYNNLGLVHASRDELAEAEASYRRALEISKEYPEAILNLGAVLVRQGNFVEAERAFRRAVALAPENPEAHNALGNALFRRERFDEAVSCYRQAISLDRSHAMAHYKLGKALMRLDRLDEAEKSYRRALDLKPEFAPGHNALGLVLYHRGQASEARASLARALALDPSDSAAHNNLANALLDLGRIDEARQSYRKAIELSPGYVTAYYGLAQIQDFEEGCPEFARLEVLRHDERLPAREAINLRFALGKMYADVGNHDRAFANYHEGNALRRQELARQGRSYSAEEHSRYIDALISCFTSDLFVGRSALGDGDGLVFIIGMPRSGTTLVEQIIASHPLAYGAGELADIPRAERLLSQQMVGNYPHEIANVPTRRLCELGADYMAHIRRLAGAARITTDKYPQNFLRLGLIALILPGARVIHCRRNAMDTCISCYFQNFSLGNEFSNDLHHLAAYWRDYRRLMAHWLAVLPVPILELQHEALVADPTGESKRLIEFCGLKWDDRCLKFYESGRTVHTASNMQVRRPISARSLDRWRQYEKHITPLTDELRDQIGPETHAS